MAKKRSTQLSPQEEKRERIKQSVRKEILAEIRKDGPTRDEVRRALDALPPWTPFEEVARVSSPMARALGISDPAVLRLASITASQGTINAQTKSYENSRYFVSKTPHENGGFTLSVRTQQRDARHDWREFQRIKNELCGPEYEAVEVYPAESRLVDTSNQFYIHVLPPGMMVPVGFQDRLVALPGDGTDGTNQRPWEPGEAPADAIAITPDTMKTLLLAAREQAKEDQQRHDQRTDER